MNINILDHDIELEIGPATPGSEAIGICNRDRGFIWLDEDSPVDLINSTLCHEIIHLIAEYNSLEMTEPQVDAFGLGIHSFIKNNRKVIEELFY